MNIALIGLGMVASTHVAAIRDAGFKLAGVLARHPDRTAEFAAQHHTKVFTSAGEIASDPSVDFAILATPPDAREDIMQTLCASKKPVLMEKPIERTLSAARRIVDLCAAHDTPLGVVLQHRTRAASIAAKRALKAGEIGHIATIELRIPWWREQSYYDEPGRGTYARDGGGVMISQAIHTLDLALWLAGPVERVQALMRTTPLHNLEAEDWAGALLEFSSGAVGTLMASTATFPGAAESITLHGTKGQAHLCSGVLTLTLQDGKTQSFGNTASTGGGADPMAFTHAWHQSVISDFAHAVKTGTPPPISGQDALGSHALINAIQTAHRTGQRTEVRHT